MGEPFWLTWVNHSGRTAIPEYGVTIRATGGAKRASKVRVLSLAPSRRGIPRFVMVRRRWTAMKTIDEAGVPPLERDILKAERERFIERVVGMAALRREYRERDRREALAALDLVPLDAVLVDGQPDGATPWLVLALDPERGRALVESPGGATRWIGGDQLRWPDGSRPIPF